MQNHHLRGLRRCDARRAWPQHAEQKQQDQHEQEQIRGDGFSKLIVDNVFVAFRLLLAFSWQCLTSPFQRQLHPFALALSGSTRRASLTSLAAALSWLACRSSRASTR